jgi:hypothetical protein
MLPDRLLKCGNSKSAHFPSESEVRRKIIGGQEPFGRLLKDSRVVYLIKLLLLAAAHGVESRLCKACNFTAKAKVFQRRIN